MILKKKIKKKAPGTEKGEVGAKKKKAMHVLARGDKHGGQKAPKVTSSSAS
jgi:hypothetical protein